MKLPRPNLLALAWILFLATASASGLTIVPVADERLADTADVIAYVRVVSTQAVETERGIVTRYRAAPLAVLKGAPRSNHLEFDLPGGMLVSGQAMLVSGIPTLEAGEELLVFLRGGAAGQPARVVHDAQGIFRRGAGIGDGHWLRADSAASVVGTAAAYRTPRHASRFTGWLADRAGGNPRPVDYLEPDAALSDVPPPAKFTRFLENPPVRWFVFDDGGSVEWFWHVPAGAGDVTPALASLRTARLLWNRAPRAPIRIFPGGSTDAAAGRQPDGVSTITFEDPNGVLSGDYDCETGGSLMATIISIDLNRQRQWKGESYAVIDEADFVINRGATCFFEKRRSLADLLMTRDFGRILGLGLSCGGSRGRACIPGTPESEAIMSGISRIFPRPLALGSDDIAGIRFLYDSRFEGRPTPPCEVRRGDPRFCTLCGPCGQGQGDCDRDSECAPGLRCTDDVGARFGFAPGIDVCLRDSGIPVCNPLSFGTGRFCTDCGPCAAGLGDCDRDAECAPGLQCVENVGAQFGFAAGVDVCLPGGPPPVCSSQNGRGDFCGLPGCGPCGAGEGDCDSDAECAPGLRCVDDIGPQFGFGPRTDVCQ